MSSGVQKYYEYGMSAIQLCCGDIVICGDITWCTLIAVCTVQRLNWIMQWLRKSAILPFKILRTVPIWPDALGLWCAVSKQDQRARIPTLSWSYRLDCCRCHRRRRSLDRGLAIAGNSSMAASWSRWESGGWTCRIVHQREVQSLSADHLESHFTPIYFCLSLSPIS